MAHGTQTPQAECWPHCMRRKSSLSLFQWTSWKENRRHRHTLLCRNVEIIPKLGLSVLSVLWQNFSAVHPKWNPTTHDNTCGLCSLSWCLISAFWVCKSRAQWALGDVLGMFLEIRDSLHLGYIALIWCTLCDGPTFAAFWPNSNFTRWRSDHVWYVPHQYSFLEHVMQGKTCIRNECWWHTSLKWALH